MQRRDLENTTSVVWQRTIIGDSMAGDEEGWETGVWLLPVHHCTAGQAARSLMPPVLAKTRIQICLHVWL